MVNPEKISLIRTRTNITEIIGQYLKLQKKGRNYWTVCPFHEDNAPSMSVSPEKQIYRCFSCQASGNVFTFLQKYKKISFLEALKEVAALVNIDLQELEQWTKNKYDSETLKIFAINALACEYFMYHLDSKIGIQAKKYLEQRNIDNKLREQFSIGLAPSEDGLVAYLQQKGYKPSELVISGLVVYQNNHFNDYFRNRIMFPIRDIEHNIIGFSSRSYLENQQPKYMNTLETNIFKKNQSLYNLSFAKNHLHQDKYLLICEGFMDIIALSKIGINNAVAIMGTSLSAQHCSILKKVTNEIILFLDGDDAGIIATFKMISELWYHKFNVKVVNNPTTLDPDDLIKKEGAVAVRALIKNSIHPVDFVLNYFQNNLDLKKIDNVTELLKKVTPFFQLLHSAVEVNFYLNKLETITNLNKKILEQTLFAKQTIETTDKINPKNAGANKNLYLNPIEKSENIIIFSLLYTKETITNSELNNFSLIDPIKKVLLSEIISWYDKNPQAGKVNYEDFLKSLQQEQVKKSLEMIYSLYNKQEFVYRPKLINDCQETIYNYLIKLEKDKWAKKWLATNNVNEKIAIGEKIISLSKNIKREKSGQ
ncbi:DNA primase [Spiroplasma endosymbiont of Nephrotoma flavescens]|uniref:DNA primase n=1 Tax=Spiroplasma endosymbiont of Nephrotoma flavescens TaxID=3066302 RepID=UPI00313EEBB4